MEGHRLRVGALAWSSTLLSSGGRDKNIYQRDIRAQEDFVSKLSGHKSEVRYWIFFPPASSGLSNLLYMVFSMILNFFVFHFGSSKVCGLKWSYDNRELASGGNDNRVCNCKLYHCYEISNCTVIFLLLLCWY